MNLKFVGIGLVVVGAILGYFGWQEYQSVGSSISSAITGSPTDRAMWMLIAAAAAIVVGGALFVKGR